MKYEIKRLNDTDAVVISDEEIKDGNWCLADYVTGFVDLKGNLCNDGSYYVVKANNILLGNVLTMPELLFSFNNLTHELRYCKKIIATISPFKIEGLPMLELPNQEEDVENFDELFLMNRNDLRVLFNAGNAGSGGALYNRVRKYNGFDEFRESNEGREFLIDKLYKAAQKQYSKSDMISAFIAGTNSGVEYQSICEDDYEEAEKCAKLDLEDFKQSLQKKQFPSSVELTEDFKIIKWHYYE